MWCIGIHAGKIPILIKQTFPGAVGRTFNTSTWEAEMGVSLSLRPACYSVTMDNSKTLFLKTKVNKAFLKKERKKEKEKRNSNRRCLGYKVATSRDGTNRTQCPDMQLSLFLRIINVKHCCR